LPLLLDSWRGLGASLALSVAGLLRGPATTEIELHDLRG